MMSQSFLSPKIALVGDSTVASNGGWGDAFADLVAPDVQVLNFGRGGRSSKSYRDEGIWSQVLAEKPDWILIQFGHNDQPGKGPDRETDAQTSYRENLRRFVRQAREVGAKPVLISSLTRRNFGTNGKIDPQNLEPMVEGQLQRLIPDHLADYAQATQIVAREEGVPFLDLNARSVAQINAIGPLGAREFDSSDGDKTHLSPFGASQTAPLVASEIHANVPELAAFLKTETT